MALSITIVLCSISSLTVGTTVNDEVATVNPNKITYGVIVDCGSSGTRAHIYIWDCSVGFQQLLNNIEPLRNGLGTPITKKIHPGLSSLEETPEKASDYMQPIIEFITDNIPKESLVNTGIYIMGTAGMRMLEKNQLSILNDISEHLKKNYNFALVKTSVISGANEGIYQWTTVNSKAKRFRVTDNRYKAKTYGLIEMGGASIQVTYQLHDSYDQIYNSLAGQPGAQEAFKAQISIPEIGRKVEQYNYTVVSTTFLGLGSNSIRQAYVDYLLMNGGYQNDHSFGFHMDQKALIVKDPCLPIGSHEQLKKPTKMLLSMNQTVGFDIDDDDITFNVVLMGIGQHSLCLKYLENTLFTAKREQLNCKPNKPCTMSLLGTSFVPFDKHEFLGLGDFYYTTKEMMNLEGKFDKKNFVQMTKKICETPYNELLRQYPEANKHDPSRVLLECFKASWIHIFLEIGLKMRNEYKLETIGQIDGDNLDWTLGAVIGKALTIQRSSESGRLSKLIRTRSGFKLIV